MICETDQQYTKIMELWYICVHVCVCVCDGTAILAILEGDSASNPLIILQVGFMFRMTRSIHYLAVLYFSDLDNSSIASRRRRSASNQVRIHN